MLNQKLLDEVGALMGQMLAEGPKVDLEKNWHAFLQSALARLDLVSREEFDIQREVLLRTREKLEKLETHVAELGRSANHEVK